MCRHECEIRGTVNLSVLPKAPPPLFCVGSNLQPFDYEADTLSNTRQMLDKYARCTVVAISGRSVLFGHSGGLLPHDRSNGRARTHSLFVTRYRIFYTKEVRLNTIQRVCHNQSTNYWDHWHDIIPNTTVIISYRISKHCKVFLWTPYAFKSINVSVISKRRNSCPYYICTSQDHAVILVHAVAEIIFLEMSLATSFTVCRRKTKWATSCKATRSVQKSLNHKLMCSAYISSE